MKSDDLWESLSVSNSEIKKCAKDTEGNGCTEKKINCVDKISDCSEIICPQLNPSDAQHTCIKDPEGNGCKNIYYCE